MGSHPVAQAPYKPPTYIEVTEAVLRKIAQNIAEAVHPERIVLFGSHARQNAARDSDIDLLIVMSSFDKHKRSQVLSSARRELMDFLVPIDLLVYSREEIQNFAVHRGHVVNTALAEGRVLYERQS